MGLDDYQLVCGVKDRQSINITKKRHTQAHTILLKYNVGCIGNITLSPSCSVPMYVSGIPSKAEASRMLLHTFTSDRASKFVRTCLSVPSVTLIVPAGCAFRTILTSNDQESGDE
ncbi:unnamed protein product, partial [Mesorhabditis belari]|uniref:Uncharacterized protein n=1 Tax=Mesorhabditis belari TaxID=2138241 RepID=A0AAF3EKN1_9BILA